TLVLDSAAGNPLRVDPGNQYVEVVANPNKTIRESDAATLGSLVTQHLVPEAVGRALVVNLCAVLRTRSGPMPAQLAYPQGVAVQLQPYSLCLERTEGCNGGQ